MPNVGTITGSMVLDPSAYISGLNQSAAATKAFQSGVNTVSFAGFNRSMFATTTLLYGINRIMSSMSKGMEEYSNMLGRIGTVADLTAASVSALADSMKQLSVRQGVLRSDIMGGMYTAAQAGFSTPVEMRAMATSGALLSRASGKEINVKKSTDLLSSLRQGLGIGNNALKSGRTTDLLLRARDIGRWELDQMAEALGKVVTVYGNQFGGTLGGEETLRQVASIMSVASLAGLPLGMVSTGTRRLAERTFQLSGTKRGEPLREALRGIGYKGRNPIMQAYNKGPISYLQDLTKMTGGSSEELYRLGYQSRELSALTSTLRGKGGALRSAYSELSYANTAGTTEKYNERMRQTYDYKRDQLRAQWQITSQEFMQAALPLIGQFTSVLEGLNRVAQSLPDSAKSFMLLVGALTSLRFAMNLFGFRSAPIGGGAMGGAGKAMAGLGGILVPSGGGMSSFGRPNGWTPADRQSRRASSAASRSSNYRASFGGAATTWPSNIGAPWGTGFTPFKPMMWNEVPHLARSPGGGFGPRWYNSPRREPMNFVQEWNMFAGNEKHARARAASNAKYWAADGTPLFGLPPAARLIPSRERMHSNVAMLGQRFLGPDPTTGMMPSGRELQAGGRASPWGPTAEQRIRWAAYKRGQSVNFDSGTYGSMNASGKAFGGMGHSRVGSASVAVWQKMQNELNYNAGVADYYRNRPQTSMLGNMWNSVRPQSGFKSESYGGNSLFGGIGKATGGLVNSIESAIGPIAKFAIVTAAASKIIEGFAYRSSPDRVGGAQGLKIGGGGVGIGSSWGQGAKLLGSFLSNRFKEMPGLAGEYARQKGYVPYGLDPTADKAALGSMSRGKAFFGATPIGILARAFGIGGMAPLGLEGYRKGNPNDVSMAASREELTPDQVRALTKGGIDFGKFETIRPYLNKHMKGLGYDKTTDWDALAKSNGGFDKMTELIRNALAPVAAKLAEAADKLAAAGDHWLGPWRQGVGGSMIGDNILNSRILQGRQWDIYSAGNSPKPGEYGAPNWNAGGRDYRKMYDVAREELDQNYGNFAAPSWTDGARNAIAARSQLWKDRAGGFAGSVVRGINGGFTSNDPNFVGPTQFRSSTNDPNFVGPKLVRPSWSVTRASAFPTSGGLDVEDPYKHMLEQGDEAIRNNSRLKNFLKVMPDIGTMPEAEARGWFERMTGRSSSSDAFGEANFKNFRGMNVADYVDVKQTGFPTQYAQATQFGTAEAYNQLLPRQDPTEKLVFALDKLDKYFETLSTSEEGRQTELDKVTKLALQFFTQPDIGTLGANLAAMAADVKDT